MTELTPDVVHREAGGYSRIPGRIVRGSDEVHRAFARISSGSVDLGSVSSGIIPDATVVGGGMVLTTTGHVLAESLNCIENLSTYQGFTRSLDGQAWTLDEPIDIAEYVSIVPGRQHVLLKSAWDANYGHWLWDTLSRLPLVHDLELGQLRPLFVVNHRSGAMERVVLESLALAGYGPDDIVWHDFEARRYESLVVLGSLTRHPEDKSRLAVHHLTELGASIPPAQLRRLYLTRKDYTRRLLVNEDSLWPLLEERGFVRISPESLDLAGQIALLKGAHVVVGNLGASFSSLAFAPMGVRVLALTTEAMEHDFFYDIVCLKEGEYVAIQGISAEEAPTLSSDFHIEGFALAQVLDQYC